VGLPHYTTQLSPASVRDLPRFDPGDSTQPKRALIGDKRNDENLTCCSSRREPAVRNVDAHPRASFEYVQRAGEVALPVAGDQRFHPRYLRR
jgi:hypothetical protein